MSAASPLLDAHGAWLTLTGLDLRLSLMPLLRRSVVIDRLHADTLTLARLPSSSPPAKPAPSSGPITASIPSLPVKIYLDQLTIDRVAVARAVTQTADIDVGLTGAAQVTGTNEGQAHLVLRDLGGSGVYTAQAALTGQDLAARVTLDEPTRGMLSRLAALPDLGALHLALALDGPQDKAAVGLALSAGALTARAKGTIDIPGEAADLAIDAHAPAMKPAPGIGWQSVDVALQTTGPFTAPNATGHVVLSGLAAQGVALQRLTAEIQGSLGAVSLKASLAGIAAPGLPPGLLGDTPVAVTANAVLDAPDRPVHLTVSHPLLTLHVDGTTKPDLAASIVLDLPDLAPLAAIGHQTVAGSAHITGHGHPGRRRLGDGRPGRRRHPSHPRHAAGDGADRRRGQTHRRRYHDAGRDHALQPDAAWRGHRPLGQRRAHERDAAIGARLDLGAAPARRCRPPGDRRHRHDRPCPGDTDQSGAADRGDGATSARPKAAARSSASADPST